MRGRVPDKSAGEEKREDFLLLFKIGGFYRERQHHGIRENEELFSTEYCSSAAIQGVQR